MNATKRKFNYLLNGIGSRPPSSSEEVNNSPRSKFTSRGLNLLAKKRRTGSSLSTTSSNPFTSSRFAPSLHKKSASAAETVMVHTEPPKYSPWDREEFLKRLKTFSNVSDWTPKPKKVDEVQWAKRGWVCHKVGQFERVRCGLCNVELIVKLNRKHVDGKDREDRVYIAHEIEEALVDKYANLIITSHNENCLWRKRGCDDSIFKLPLSHPATMIKALGERYQELKMREDTLPHIFNMSTPAGFDLDAVLAQLPLDFPSGSTSNGVAVEVNRVAFLMALFGWQGYRHERLGNQLGSVSCQACFRVIGLWMFKSKKLTQAGEETAAPPLDTLQVIEQHRTYCPWRNPASQSGLIKDTKFSPDAMAGWQVVLHILKTESYLRRKQVELTAKTSHDVHDTTSDVFGSDVDYEDAISIRDKQDKDMQSRLRRVRSLFDTKSMKKLSSKSKST